MKRQPNCKASRIPMSFAEWTFWIVRCRIWTPSPVYSHEVHLKCNAHPALISGWILSVQFQMKWDVRMVTSSFSCLLHFFCGFNFHFGLASHLQFPFVDFVEGETQLNSTWNSVLTFKTVRWKEIRTFFCDVWNSYFSSWIQFLDLPMSGCEFKV